MLQGLSSGKAEGGGAQALVNQATRRCTDVKSERHSKLPSNGGTALYSFVACANVWLKASMSCRARKDPGLDADVQTWEGQNRHPEWASRVEPQRGMASLSRGAKYTHLPEEVWCPARSLPLLRCSAAALTSSAGSWRRVCRARPRGD